MNETTHPQGFVWRERVDSLRESKPRFAAFLSRAIAATDARDLTLYPPQALETLFARTASHIGERETGHADIRLWEPDADVAEATTVIDIYSEDMPFIVDSALAAIRAAGGTIRFMSHPLVPVDRTHTPWTLLSHPGADARYESVLQIHIDTPDPETRAAIEAELSAAMTDVRRTVSGWRPMLERLRAVVVGYREHPPALSDSVVAEAMHFLAWLADHNFTFLGMREYAISGSGDARTIARVEGSGIGILQDESYLYLRQGDTYVETTDQHLQFLASNEPVLVTKANKRATVHRRVHMDYVGVKLYNDAGEVTGELRILGLFTSMAQATPHSDVPIVRRKISEVMRRSGLDPRGHAGKALMNALESYPRDELFQIETDQLLEFATDISTLPDRPRVRVLPRIDPFDNFVSVLLYLPRERYDSDTRARVGHYLAQQYDARISAFTPGFPEGDLARVHYILGRNGGPTPRPDRAALEDAINEMTRRFAERILSAADHPAAVSDFADAFSAGYESDHDHTTALDDIAILKTLSDTTPLAVRLTQSHEGPGTLALRFYHRADPLPLSDRVPMLENFGFSVIDERTYEITPRDRAVRFVHDMTIRPVDGATPRAADLAPRLEPALLSVAMGTTETDGFNRLTVGAELDHHDVAIVRALGHYLKQVGIAYSQSYLATALANQAPLARQLIALFHTLHDPDVTGARDTEADRLRETIGHHLDSIASIDEDRIVRRLFNLVDASVRTNFYQRTDEGERRPALAIKFDCARVEGLPAPRPYREILVYSPRVEGLHMRGGPIARGGLRWSDRPEDFRTEVLGLMKAQMTKNAVIVPVGAKGGFVPRRIPAGADRETAFAEGTACYKVFVGALLDITDTLEGQAVVPPARTVRRDGDDPYLVVAADKGTASFSDTANAIALERDYWLGDAFASGGSAGYDHKEMGITARGAWEAVKRHFREMDRDIQTQAFTVAGVGDMSGDVFGNGMLLSPQIRLVAAFDHRDIFIDPDPDPQTSFAERKRLFEMGRSSWQDYDRACLSEGGDIFPRTRKTLELSPQIQEILGLPEATASPNEVMRAILSADVDFMWFGGIGTYIKGPGETDLEVGDRANDAIRIDGDQVRAKVVGEGANLGVTQRGRIAYALAGGRINTDAIDNSAGVNSSDLEVNIKIALADLVRNETLTIEARNALLADMTEEVAGLCLRNNYLQSLALSLSQQRAMADFPDLVDFLDDLEREGHIERKVEYLPEETALAERAAAGIPFTRPELAVLLAYAKNTLFADLAGSSVPDDPYLAKELYRYFPDTLRERHGDAVENHRLRREVIATVLSNAMINRGGPAFVHTLAAATSADAGAVAFAYAAARDAFALQDLNAEVDALDGHVSGATQLALYGEIQRLQIAQTLWFLRNEDVGGGLSELVARYRSGVEIVRAALPDLMTPYMVQAVSTQERAFEEGGTPPDLARHVATLSVVTLASDIALVAHRADAEVADAARALFFLLGRFRLGHITEQSGTISTTDKYDRMALDRAIANMMRALRDLSGDVLSAGTGPLADRIAAWQAPREAAIARVAASLGELIEGELTVSRLSVAAGLLSDLSRS